MKAPWLLALVMLVLSAAPARAHLSPNSAIALDFESRSVTIEVLAPLGEIAYAEGQALPEGAAQKQFLVDFAYRHLAVRTPEGVSWRIDPRSIDLVHDGWAADARLTFEATPPAGASPRALQLHWDGIIDRTPNHVALVFVRSDFGGGALSTSPVMIGALQGQTRDLRIDRGQASPWRGTAAALRLGMAHIGEGYDHLLFLIALLLPAPLGPRAGRWGEFIGARRTLIKLALTVSAFTIGHSLTLLGGAFLGWRLPAQPVEVAIALSILVSAAHAWRPLFGGREPLLAAGFGLVHGLAFATVIGGFDLEPVAKAQAILGFNLGVEAMQLAVVIAVLPLLLLTAATPGYVRLRRGAAAFAGVAALFWLAERTIGAPRVLAKAVENLFAFAPAFVALGTLAALGARFAGKRTAARADANSS